VLHLARAFADRGHDVTVAVLRDRDPAGQEVPDNVTVVPIPASGRLRGRRAVLDADPAGWRRHRRAVLTPLIGPWPIRHLDGLAAHLSAQQPEILYAAGPYQNLTALWARDLAGVATRVIGSERIAFPHFRRPLKRTQARWRHLPEVIARAYPRLDGLVAISHGVAEELETATGIPATQTRVIYNPVTTPDIASKAAAPAEHRWLGESRSGPVIVAVGRLTGMKGFPTLLRAFAELRRARRARLLILGDGPQRRWLTVLAHRLGIADDVAMPGWSGNPFAAYANADLFALSSRNEGFGNVLVEAMACGCPVVSTDCPSGPREILAGGRYGPLMPVGDPIALARAMAATLDTPPDPETLKARAQDFSVDRSADAHLALFRACLDDTDDG
jgi:glycosyltransferase involved in cell wall biosynthesis